MSRKGPRIAGKVYAIEEKKETLETLLVPYEQQEFLPSHVIAPLLQLAFPSSTTVHVYSHQHYIIKVPISTLLKAPMMNWQFNRPADRTRCEDIARYIAISKKPVDTMMYVSFNNKKRTFDIVDGIHRYTALTIIQEKSQHLDFL